MVRSPHSPSSSVLKQPYWFYPGQVYQVGIYIWQKWQSCPEIWIRSGSSKATVAQRSTKPPLLSPARPGLAQLSLHLQQRLKCWGRAVCGLHDHREHRTERMVEVKGAQWNWNGQRRQYLLQIWVSCIQRIQPSAGPEDNKCSLQTEFRLSWHAENSVKLESNPGYHSS